MKRLISILCTLLALAAFAFSVYYAIPVFPYLNEPEVLLGFGAFLLFYYLAYRTGKSRNSEDLADN
ncbi:hypothetical protein [Mucilaginibacter antarcticus]|uniref:Uncharacterized protein n=1 Tax=Mucilaginibacter antarcticus TaxID=1855725 RepID=A0ABW5XT55_9SPHI